MKLTLLLELSLICFATNILAGEPGSHENSGQSAMMIHAVISDGEPISPVDPAAPKKQLSNAEKEILKGLRAAVDSELAEVRNHKFLLTNAIEAVQRNKRKLYGNAAMTATAAAIGAISLRYAYKLEKVGSIQKATSAELLAGYMGLSTLTFGYMSYEAKEKLDEWQLEMNALVDKVKEKERAVLHHANNLDKYMKAFGVTKE